jgi:hypothetical protein
MPAAVVGSAPCSIVTEACAGRDMFIFFMQGTVVCEFELKKVKYFNFIFFSQGLPGRQLLWA